MTLEEEAEFLSKTYNDYLEVRKGIRLPIPPAPYDWVDMPDPLSSTWIAYSFMSQEFAREISNSINELSRLVRSLDAWERVIEPLGIEAKNRVAREFVDPIATVAANLPYVIKSRFIFACVHLCHQANLTKLKEKWADDLELDTQIEYNKFDSRYGVWSGYKAMNECLQKLGSNSFYSNLHDFRNAYNHRFSLKFVVGLTQAAVRHRKGDGKVYYTLGGVEPLQLKVVAQHLKDQLVVSHDTLKAFQILVGEHTSAIKQHEAERM